MKLDFKKLVKQKGIDLYNKGLHDDDLDVLYQVIGKSKVLKELNLGGNKLTLVDGKLANAIAKNKKLEVLHLDRNNIGPRGIKQLADALKKNGTSSRRSSSNASLITSTGKDSERIE